MIQTKLNLHVVEIEEDTKKTLVIRGTTISVYDLILYLSYGGTITQFSKDFGVEVWKLDSLLTDLALCFSFWRPE